MNESYRCPKCGQPVPPEAPEGLCPRCVGALNLDSETGVTGAGASTVAPPPSAAELAPHFPQLEILEVLGRGGMGVVYKVRQKELDRIAALKILPPGIGGDPAFAERFAREAKALARLNHPGIVTIYDSGRTDSLYYFLMEFVDGVSLGRLMRGARVSPREALAIVPQICDALQYAHDQGIVHRDIKPENILLDRQGRVKVADFGLAKLLGTGPGRAGSPLPTAHPQTDDGAHGVTRPTDGLTDAGKVMGTPAYMAPEQAEHPAAVDHRADIYALGVVFYQMLTGELPGQPLGAPSKKVQIDVRLDEVVLRALEKEPERRYQQVSEVRTALETIANSSGSAAPPTEQVGEPDSRFSWIGSLPRLGAPLVVKRGNRRVFNWPVIGVNLVWVLCLICIVLPLLLRGMSVNEDTGTIIQLLFISSTVVFFTVRVVRGLGVPVDSLPVDPDAGRSAAPAVRRTMLYMGAVLALLVIQFCWPRLWRAPSAQPGKPPATQRTSNGLAPARFVPRLNKVVKRVAATTARQGDIGVRLDALGTVESSNSVSFAIPENYCQEVIKKFDAHQALAVEAYDREGKRFGHGSLSAVDNRIDPATGTLACKASLAPEGQNLMLPGRFLNLRLLLEVKPAVTLVPADAILRDSQTAFTWVVQADHTVTRRAVQVGVVDGKWVEIQSGVSPGEVVASGELADLGEGQLVHDTSVPEAASAPASHQPGEQPDAAQMSSLTSPPTVAAIVARYVQAKGELAGPDKTRTLILKGRFTSRDGLGTLEAEALVKSPDKWLLSLRNTNGPVWRRAFDGSVAWEVSSWAPPEVDPAILLSTRVLLSLYRGDPLTPLVPNLSLKGTEPLGGGQAYVVEAALPGQAPRLWFDTQTGLLVRIEYGVVGMVLQLDFSDYRDIGGLRVPFNIREAGTESWAIQCSEVKRNEPLEDSTFKHPPSQ